MDQEPEVQAPEKISRSTRIVGLCIGVGVLAMIAGLLVSAGTKGEPATPSNPEVEEAVALPAMQPATVLATARTHLKSGNVGEAYRFFQKFTAGRSAKALDEQLRFEIAVCAEGVGDIGTASQIFETMAVASKKREFHAAAILGLARLRFRAQQYASVDHVLAPAQLTGVFSGNEIVQGEAEYVRAIALSRIGNEPRSTSLLSPRGLIHGRLSWSLPQVLATVGQYTNQSSLATPIDVSGVGIDATVSASLPRQSLKGIVHQLAVASDLQTEWSAAATRAVENRNAVIDFRLRAMSVVMDQLLNPVGLAWRTRDNRLSVVASNELDPAEKRAWEISVARRGLWGAVTAFPDSKRSGLALLSLGNLDAHDEPADARARYDEILRQYRSAELRMAASFNRGKVALANGDPRAATESFLAAAEFGAGTLPDSIALLFVGRLRLEHGNAAEAINPLLRAVGHLDAQLGSAGQDRTEHDDALAAAVQTLAIAWLDSDKPLAANRALVRHRKLLGQETYRDATAFLTAVSTYRIASTEQRRLQEGRTLIAALTRVRPELLFPQNGIALIGESWNQLGLTAQMAVLYTSQLDAVQSEWIRKRMVTSLIDYHRLAGEEKRVGELVAMLSGFEGAGVETKVAWAEHSLRAGDVDESIAACRLLLKTPGVNHSDVLSVMGRAFQKAGNFENAAACFAGMLPADVGRKGSTR